MKGPRGQARGSPRPTKFQMHPGLRIKAQYAALAALIAFGFVLRSTFYLFSTAAEFYAVAGSGKRMWEASKPVQQGSDQAFNKFMESLGTEGGDDVERLGKEFDQANERLLKLTDQASKMDRDERRAKERLFVNVAVFVVLTIAWLGHWLWLRRLLNRATEDVLTKNDPDIS